MKRIFLAVVAVFAAAFAFTANAQTLLPNDPTVRVGKLDNGLTYYIKHNDKPAQRAEFYLATHVGAIQETPDQDGLAHFLEHMCFNGTKNFPGKSLLEYLQSIGANFGRNINAATGVEQTTYMLNNIPVIREGIIDTCLLVLHDYSHFVTNDPAEIDAEHIVGELMKGFKNPRKLDCEYQEKLKGIDKTLGDRLATYLQKALPVIALGGHPALSTAYMNDCEPLMCFAQQVNGYGREGDVLLGISTSGNSQNVIYAAVTAKAKGMKVIGLTGAKDSKLSELADVCIQVPETETYKIQELHLPVYHCLCLMLEEEFFGIK